MSPRHPALLIAASLATIGAGVAVVETVTDTPVQMVGGVAIVVGVCGAARGIVRGVIDED